MPSTVQIRTLVAEYNDMVYSGVPSQTLHSPRESRMIGLVFADVPVESEYVTKGVVVPLA
jgi:hypothetical protein